ncbi:MAG TPA: DnaJ domain-containing protein [Phenylobacterium sp.]|nr:DnaJ domain-containing protein [Phenylobacterium sp.]
MLYIALGCAALAVFVWMGGDRRVLKRREWRLLAGALAVAAFAAAAFVGLRGEWGRAIVLVVVGLWLASTARLSGPSQPRPTPAKVGEAEARSILGVGPDATPEEIQAAYSRLMRMAHPDKGGTDGLAAQLNAARDRLLRK